MIRSNFEGGSGEPPLPYIRFRRSITFEVAAIDPNRQDVPQVTAIGSNPEDGSGEPPLPSNWRQGYFCTLAFPATLAEEVFLSVQ